MKTPRREWRDRNKWAQASVVPPVMMIWIGATVWPVGVPAILLGVYLILIIHKARREIRSGL